MPSRPIIIDTDPGQDDAIAILLALASPEFEVLGITTVAGNVPLARTTENALKLVELACRTDIPVHAGCVRPMLRPLHTAEYVHGKTGLDGPDLPSPRIAAAEGHAVDFIVDTLMRAPEKSVTVCPLGPLTNIAMAIIKEPRILDHIRQVVLMGGGFFEGGNTTPAAEFNIYVDPHAAHVVFDAAERVGLDVVMAPLDCTHSALMPRRFFDDLRALGSPVGDAAAAMLDFYQRFDVAKYGEAGGPLHDPCVIAYLLQPDLFEAKRCHVAVEIHSETTIGMTVVDWWGVRQKAANCTVLRRVDPEGFFTLIAERLGRYPKQSDRRAAASGG